MENHEGKGGSYTRNPDGSLTLNERTEQAAVKTEAKTKATAKAAEKKD